MNERDYTFSSKCQNICLTCLKTTDDLYPMSFEFRNEYKKFVESMKEDAEMMICTICSWQFRRFLKFKQQCQVARTFLKDTVQTDLKSILLIKKLTFSHNFKTTKAKVHFYPDIHSLQGTRSRQNVTEPVNNPLVNSSPPINPQMNGSPVNNSQRNGSTVNNSQRNSSIVNNSPVNNSLGNVVQGLMHDDGMYDSTEFNNDDDDELPLVLLKRKREKRKKSRKELVTTDEELKSKPIQTENCTNGSSKRAKELKDGFTSRMVQETDEYVVIKLTKDQVLQEKEEKSKTEAYVQSPFKCEECVRGFNFQDVLRSHLEKHTMENGSFQCNMCSQYCRSAVSLRGHVKSHTTRYKCKLCGVIRLSRQHLLEHHAITHTRQAVTYSCDTCQFNTNKRTVMQRHVKSHASSEPHACDKCGKLFKSIDSLRVHTLRHDKSSRLRCAQCDVTFMYHSLLRRHVTRVHERREYYCVECDAQFKSNESLRLHFKKAKRHRDSSAYKHACAQCSMRFFTPSSLSAHLSTAHDAPRAHACALCRRRYSSRDALRSHAWRVHTQKKAMSPKTEDIQHCATFVAHS